MCTFTIVFKHDLGNAHGIEKLVNPKVRRSEEGLHLAGRLRQNNSCDLTRFSVGGKNRIWQVLQQQTKVFHSCLRQLAFKGVVDAMLLCR